MKSIFNWFGKKSRRSICLRSESERLSAELASLQDELACLEAEANRLEMKLKDEQERQKSAKESSSEIKRCDDCGKYKVKLSPLPPIGEGQTKLNDDTVQQAFSAFDGTSRCIPESALRRMMERMESAEKSAQEKGTTNE